MSTRLQTVAVFSCVVLVLALPHALRVPTGWFPWDDGTLAQGAWRVALGELPHVHFTELYSGALNYWHALGFRLWGVDFLVLRWQLVGVYAAGMLALAFLLRRGLPPSILFVVLLTAATYGPLIYAGPMPSWYNLVCGILACLALAAYAARNHALILFGAGFILGISLVIKITGLYAVMAAGLALLWLEQTHATRSPSQGRTRLFLATKTALLLGVIAAVASLLVLQNSPYALLTMGLPIALFAMLLMVSDWMRASPGSSHRFGYLFRIAAPFMAGLGLPLIVFAAMYAQAGELEALFTGLFVSPQARLGHDDTAAVIEHPAPYAVLVALLVSVPLIRRGGTAMVIVLVAWAMTVLWMLALADRNPLAYQMPWAIIRAMPLSTAVVFCLLAWKPLNSPAIDADRSRLLDRLALVVVFALCLPLIQFPFPHAIYTVYWASLGLAAWAVCVMQYSLRTRPLVLVVLIGLVAHSQIWPGRLAKLGSVYEPNGITIPLDVERASLRARIDVAESYGALIQHLRSIYPGGSFFAGPDSPEVCFMAALPCQHPSLFELFEPHYADVKAHEEALYDWIIEARVTTLVINLAPPYARRYSDSFLNRLAPMFEQWNQVGGRYLVGVRSDPGPAAGPRTEP